jgi:hypothetical protein
VSTSSGERQQALEIFGIVVRTWSADGAEEELARWIWLAKALRVGDRQLRNRGLTLLSSFLHRDPTLPGSEEVPSSPAAFEAVGVAFLELLQAVEEAEYDSADHRGIVLGLLADLAEGNIVDVRGPQGADGEKTGGTEKELLWLALARSVASPKMVEWLFAPDNPLLLVG